MHTGPFLALLLVAAVLFSGPFPERAWAESGGPAAWTILFYGAGDGDEKNLLRTLARIKASLTEARGVEFVALIDRSGKYAGGKEALGENFTGARLYRLTGGRAERLGGGKEFPEIAQTGHYDANMGDAQTLRKFIRFAKARYPARRYALVFFSHGCGVYFCPDDTHDDALQPAEVSAVLGRDESVDLVVFDVCSMGGAEVAYQWRPGNGRFEASAMVASPSLGDALPYDRILPSLRAPAARVRQGVGGSLAGKHLDPATRTPLEFGKRIVAEAEAHRREEIGRQPLYACEAWACYDLSHAAAVKGAVDAFAVELARAEGAKGALGAIRGSGKKPIAMNYLDATTLEACWAHTPYFDLYDLARRAGDQRSLSPGVKRRAGEVTKALERMVVASFGQKQYPDFQPGKNGLSVVFPDGDAIHEGKRHWAVCSRWYTPLAARGGKQVYGRLAWCEDGATPGNGVVENWFELLDSWYDSKEKGGVNGYRW